VPQVNICINGRDYLLNCGEGQEALLSRLTDYLNNKIAGLDRVTKQSGDTNLMLTAALLASHEALSLRDEIENLRKEIQTAQIAEQSAQQKAREHEKQDSEVFVKLAQRIEELVASMSSKQEASDFRVSGPAA